MKTNELCKLRVGDKVKLAKYYWPNRSIVVNGLIRTGGIVEIAEIINITNKEKEFIIYINDIRIGNKWSGEGFEYVIPAITFTLPDELFEVV